MEYSGFESPAVEGRNPNNGIALGPEAAPKQSVPVFSWQRRRLLRISAQRYNRLDHYRRLVDALAAEL